MIAKRNKLRSWLPPLHEDGLGGSGPLVRDRYRLDIDAAGEPIQLDQASEWGAVGWLVEAMRKASNNGRCRITVKVSIERRGEPICGPEEKASASGGMVCPSECADAQVDGLDIVRLIQSMAQISDFFYPPF